MTPDTPRLAAGAPKQRGRVRRRLNSALRMFAALVFAGGIYAIVAPGGAQGAAPLTPAAEAGKALYDVSCITCHGANAQGVAGRGPSLIGVGSAAVEFQVETGRMPAARQEAQAERKDPQFTNDQARQLGAFIQELAAARSSRRARTSRRRATSPAVVSCTGSTARPATPSPAAAARCPAASTRRAWSRPPTGKSTQRC